MRGAITSTDLQYIRREALYCSLLLLLSAALLRPLVKLQEKYHHAVAGSSKHDDILHSLREANAAFHEIVLAPTAPGILKDKPSSSLDGKSSRDEHVQSPNITIHGMSSSDQEHVAEHFFTNKAAPNKTIIMTENQSHEQQNYSLLEETELEANATRQDVPRENTSAAAAAPQQYFEAMRYFGPVSISVFDNDLPSTADHGASSTCRDESVPLAEKFPSSLWRAAECVHRIANYEWSNRLHYDWIIKTRPDVALLDPLTEIADLRSDRVYLNQHIPGATTPMFPIIREMFPAGYARVLREPIGDHIAIVPGSLAHSFFRAHEMASACIDVRRRNSVTINAEALLLTWLVREGIRYETKPWFWVLVRDAEGPECKRTQWIGRTLNTSQDMFFRCERFWNISGMQRTQSATST